MYKNIKRNIKLLFEKLGLSIKRTKNLPWGHNLFFDIKKIVNPDSFVTTFDVGANIGQSSSNYVRKFKNSRIYAFEPILGTYLKLNNKFKKNKRVITVNAALGAESGQQTVVLQKRSTLNSLNKYRNFGTKSDGHDLETIKVITLDSFCNENNIEIIDFLKIDTEGYEKEVLIGAINKLKANQIRLILLELGIKKTKGTTYYNEIQEHLGELGFEPIGFYKQSQSLYSKERFLMHCDVLFINQKWSENLKPKFIKLK